MQSISGTLKLSPDIVSFFELDVLNQLNTTQGLSLGLIRTV